MTLDEFCTRLAELTLSQTNLALAVLWFHDEKQPDVVMSSGEISKIIHDTGLGNPHSTRLAESIRKSGRVVASQAGFRLKVLARVEIRHQLAIAKILGAPEPKVEQDLGFLPKEVWRNTRGYVEKVCEQMNGCYQFGFFDAAAVLMRRLVETLIIEAYEAKAREEEIKDTSGNYLMLRDLASRALGGKPIGLGRDAREALTRIKEMGDRSAHNRRFNAVRADLDKAQPGMRVIVDELINIAALRRVA